MNQPIPTIKVTFSNPNYKTLFLIPEDRCHMVLPELEEEFEENKKLSLTSLLLDTSINENGRGGDVRMNESPLGYGRNGRNGSTAVTY